MPYCPKFNPLAAQPHHFTALRYQYSTGARQDWHESCPSDILITGWNALSQTTRIVILQLDTRLDEYGKMLAGVNCSVLLRCKIASPGCCSMQHARAGDTCSSLPGTPQGQRYPSACCIFAGCLRVGLLAGVAFVISR